MSLLLTSYLLLSLTAIGSCSLSCTYQPSPNATIDNFPRASSGSLYDPNILSEVPVATVCSSANATQEISCTRNYINMIDEQLAFLYARRLGYAAVAGYAKYSQGQTLNDPNRNDAVAEGMAKKVAKYGGSEEAGLVMGGKGCQIYVSLEFEVAQIREMCDSGFREDVDTVCK